MSFETDFRVRLEALEVTPADQALVRSFQPFVLAHGGERLEHAHRMIQNAPGNENRGPFPAEVWAEHHASFFAELFGGEMDAAYLARLQAIVAIEEQSKSGVRLHLGAATHLMAGLFEEIGRRRAWSGTKTAKACGAVLRWLMADMLNAFQLAQQNLKQSIDARQEVIDGALTVFGEAALDVKAAMSEASEALARTSAQTANAVSEALDAATRTGAAAESGSASLVHTAGASAELVGSIDEVDALATQSLNAVRETTASVGALTNEIRELERAGLEIGSVVTMIAGIASQTNLLALNATIEAARAGEAGRGFSVVAAEVKNLAGQTGDATRDITAQVGAIQAAAKRSAEQLGRIASVIARVEEISSTAAAATSEQAQATASIADQARSASDAVATIKEAVDDVRSLMGALKAAVAGMDEASQRISLHGARFHTELARFTGRLTGT